MTSTPAQLALDVIARCRALGFAEAGVCPAAPSDFAAEYRRWIDEGRHGEMGYLARNVESRLDPRALMPGARSIIMVADQYHKRGDDDPPIPSGEGRITRYARGDDYHEVMKKRLHSLCDTLRGEHDGHQFRAFVDTAPVMEREHAARAGLGWVGKNTLLIHPRRGSWLLLGGVLTSLELTTDTPDPVPDHCGTCTRCIDACPTGAITPYSVDARRCVSYLTIEHRSPIDAGLREGLGDWLYGCDVCQEVCPHNSARDPWVDVGESHPAYTPRRASFPLQDVLNWHADDRSRILSKSAMKRAGLQMLQRNARTVMDNQRARGV